MNFFKHHPLGSLFSGILIVLVLVLSISGGIVTSSCNNSADTTTIMNLKCPDCPPATSDFVKITKLYNLELTKTDYEILKSAAGPGNSSDLVFQFLYDKTKTYRITMIAYAARPGHRFQADPPNPAHPLTSKELTAVSEATLALPDKFALGDQQVPIGSITNLLNSVGNPADFILTFTPELNGINIRYKICVKGFACPAPAAYTNPSPPANAN